ncbi:carbohydrate ABC transporter permease [Streptomyces sp. ADI93-02]|uniref:carbohydrate ABC transporter permease n=1 Tax=Streptomyces sp. ADI93-02 TaxID=1522757 RepID=UPI000FA203EE|nr:carbohydrate ABC transporter permease [Streptomyces sp. ADI93-02]RPK48167.1 L-arabinose transport system permease protein AraQ [Streptomyces sp. ADI93-02]
MSAEKLLRGATARGTLLANRPLLARRLRRTTLHLVLVAVSLAMVVPFLWMIITSLKTDPDLASYPPNLLPQVWDWSNYSEALEYAPFGTYFRNSLLISLGHTALNLALASMAGYALARVAFRGRTVVFMGVLATMMIPTYTKIVPQYLIAKGIPFFGGNDYLGRGGHGWLDSWWGLIVPGALTPFAIFLFRQFYLSLPRELEEAARIDGMGEFGIYARVMTPLVKPAIATVALLTFESSWNNFLWPLIITSDTDLRVIQVGLSAFQQADQNAWAYLMAGTTLATVPMVVLFLFTQRYFVQGFANSGIK